MFDEGCLVSNDGDIMDLSLLLVLEEEEVQTTVEDGFNVVWDWDTIIVVVSVVGKMGTLSLVSLLLLVETLGSMNAA